MAQRHEQHSDLTMLAMAIAEQRSALLLGDEDLTVDDLRKINEEEGFTFTRSGGLGSTLVVSEYHLEDSQIETVLRMSDQYL